jgi:hypothetical protein
MSFHKAHNFNNSINQWKQQNIFKSNLRLYSFEDILCLPSEESGLKTKINNVYDNKSISIPAKLNHVYVGSKHDIRSNSSRLVSRKQMDNKSEEYSLFPDSATHNQNRKMAIPKESESRVSYQEKARKGYSRLRPEIQKSIFGLKKYDAPDIIITSTTRNWGGHGHRCGKALDWNYSKTVTSWLMSDLGQAWLDEYNMIFYIENYKKSSKEMLSPEEEKHWRWIPWSTGLHIHLNLK